MQGTEAHEKGEYTGNMVERSLRFIFNKLLYSLDDSTIRTLHSHALQRIAAAEDAEKRSRVSASASATLSRDSLVCNFNNRPENISIGENSYIRGTLLTFPDHGKIQIGSNCYVGDHCRIWAQESIVIGNRVLISHNLNILDSNTHSLDFEARARQFTTTMQLRKWTSSDFGILGEPILIEDDAWICLNAIVMRGVTIGRGAVVAAGALVTKDVPAWTLVAGNPARVIRRID